MGVGFRGRAPVPFLNSVSDAPKRFRLSAPSFGDAITCPMGHLEAWTSRGKGPAAFVGLSPSVTYGPQSNNVALDTSWSKDGSESRPGKQLQENYRP
jgi:hypothetical protein